MDNNEEKTLDLLDEEEFELILDPVEDKEFIEKWGLTGDRTPDFDVEESLNKENEE